MSSGDESEEVVSTLREIKIETMADAEVFEQFTSTMRDALSHVGMNDMNVLIGLKSYGGEILPGEKKSSDPEITYDLISWIKEIEARTAVGFDDKGRIKAAQQLSRGPATKTINAITRGMKELKWDDFVTQLKSNVSTTETTWTYRNELFNAQITRGQTFYDFVAGLQETGGHWVSLNNRDEHEVRTLTCGAIIKSMPETFRHKVDEADLESVQKLYQRAVRFLKVNPNAKMNYKEETLCMSVSIECQRCRGKHSTTECPRQLSSCGYCRQKGHTVEECPREGASTWVRSNPPNYFRLSSSICYNCRQRGHFARECPNGPVGGRCR